LVNDESGRKRFNATVSPWIPQGLYRTGQAATSLSSEARWGLLIDTNVLSEADVDACVSACQREHGWRAEPGSKTDAQWIRKVKLTDQETGHQKFLPMMCLHCESPPCVDVCPTGASFKRADGIVLVNKHICIGWYIASIATVRTRCRPAPRRLTAASAKPSCSAI
jgi:molybdopterin-containing oxidoreductase family iron-sulfur binding subunit